MKQRNILLLSLLAMSSMAMAQDIYTNAEMTTPSDLIGTSRYVSMGGALGALGADISTISSNPAGTGLFRKSDFSLTAGGLWSAGGVNYNNKKGRATLDQMGMVYSCKVGGDKVRYVNMGFNYQKKANFNHAFLADNADVKNLSQMDQLAQLSNTWGTDQYNLANGAWNSYLTGKDEYGYYNPYGATANEYEEKVSGGLQSFDINFSTNINDRAYVGLTVGVDNMVYDKNSIYTELRDDAMANIQDYTIYNDQRVRGYGINIKAGTILRPIEESSFRIGIAAETPTWYRLRNSVLTTIDSKWDKDGYNVDGYCRNNLEEAYLEHMVITPWKVRLSMGSTVDRYFAWGAEYEYANYGKTKMAYPNNSEYGYGSAYANTKDEEMNLEYKANLRGMHTIKLGMEFNPTDKLALRVGYNYMTSQFRPGAYLNQNIDSYAMDYQNSTNYMNLSDVNIFACGIGYHGKHFYADLTYKFRAQKGQFYAFDSSYTTTDQDFITDNPDMYGVTLDPVNVCLNRHQITTTLGFRF